MSSVMRFDEWQDSNGVSLLDGSGGSITIPSGFMPAGSILQVVSTTKSDTASTTTDSFSDISGFNVSITPKFSTSKIFIVVSAMNGGDWWVTGGSIFKLVRNSTDLAVSSGATVNSTFASHGYSIASGDTRAHLRMDSFNYLDSPATTSALTYKIQWRLYSGAGSTNYLNRNWINAVGGSSTITAMEVAG